MICEDNLDHLTMYASILADDSSCGDCSPHCGWRRRPGWGDHWWWQGQGWEPLQGLTLGLGGWRKERAMCCRVPVGGY